MISNYAVVSHNFSKAICKFIKDFYEIVNCACLTTRLIYTKQDFSVLATEKFFCEPELQIQRLENFLYVNALDYFNPRRVVEYVASTKKPKDGLLILPYNSIREFIIQNGLNDFDRDNDLMVDCVMCTTQEVEGAYIIIVDYLSFE